MNVIEDASTSIPHIAFKELKVEGQALASGSFKTVYKAFWSKKNRRVALLELRHTGNVSRSEIQQESRIFLTLGRHRHLAQLLATTTTTVSRNSCMVMEFAEQGSLDHVMNKAVEDHIEVSNLVLITAAVQVADAMVHLDLHKVIHRDLAARNVLVFDFDPLDWKKVRVKVTDYGLALLTNKGFTSGNSIVEVSTRNASLAGPIRWQARESIERHIYSSRSDVWAYGVTLWEIMSRGFVPYNYIGQDREVARAILAGERLHKPDDCPDAVYAVMQSCWQHEPKDRPAMSEIHLTMQQAFAEALNMMNDDNKCVVCLQAEAVVAMLPCGHRCLCESCATVRLPSRPVAHTQRHADPKEALDSDQNGDLEAGSPEIHVERGWSGIERGFSELFEPIPFCPMCRQPVSDTKRIYG